MIRRSSQMMALAAVVGALSWNLGHAQTMPSFTGYSEMGVPCDLCDGVVNFAVYENKDGTWLDDQFFAGQDPITLDGAVTGREAFVYMYQVTNPADGLDNTLEQLTVQIPSGPSFTGGGYFTQTVFQDAFGPVNGSLAGNFTIDHPDPPTGGADVPGNNVSLLSGGPPSALTPSPSLGTASSVDPSSLNIGVLWSNAAFDSSSVAVGATFQFDPGIIIDDTSSLVFLVSDLPPRYLIGETESTGGSGALGDIPTVVPEPTAIALMLLACVGLGICRQRRDS